MKRAGAVLPTSGPGWNTPGTRSRQVLYAFLLSNLLMVCLAADAARAQSVEWARAAGGGGHDQGRGVGVDAAGNTYVTGWFDGLAVFGAGQETETTLTALGNTRDIFLAKYDPAGQLVWARNLGSADGGGAPDEADGIAVDAAGTSVIVGVLGANLTDFGNGVSLELGGPFVAKFDANGQAVWATSLGSGRPWAVAMDGTGTVFAAGGAPEPGLGGEIPTVWRVSAAGSVQWTRQALSGNGLGQGRGLGVAGDGSGDVYLTGRFGATLTFGAGDPAATVLDAGGASQVFVAKYDATGTLQWARQSTATDLFGGAYPGGIAAQPLTDGVVDPGVYVVGSFGTQVIFGPGEPNESTLGGGNGFFLARFAPTTGELVWARQATGTAEGYGVALDDAGRPHVTGAMFGGSLTLAPGEPNQTILVGAAGHVVVAKYDPGGGFVWAARTTGTLGSPSFNGGAGLAVDPQRNVLVAGFFSGAPVFGEGEAHETTLTTTGGWDMFVAKYAGAAATVTTLEATPTTASFGATVTLTADVTAAGGSPTGTVEFYDDGVLIGAAPLVGGVAELAVSTFPVGDHPLTARYTGDSGFAPSDSGLVTVTVTPAATTTTLAVSSPTVVFGELLTLTATVTAATGTPAGSVEFYDGVTLLGAAPLIAGTAQLPLTTLAVGIHTLTARYPGDDDFAASESPAQEVTVSLIPTTTSLEASATVIQFGESVLLTATVTATTVPTGSVEFFDGPTSLGSVTLTGGTAQLSAQTLGVGMHSLSASYPGSGTYAASSSQPVVVTVSQVQTTTTLVASPTNASVGEPMTLAATVMSQSGQPTGSVEFFDNGTSLGTATLIEGEAVLIASALAIGEHELSATYLGDGTFPSSVSNSVHVVVNDAPVVVPGVYWTGLDGSVNRLDPATATSTEIIQPALNQTAQGIAVDTLHGWIYWNMFSASGDGNIVRARLDGSGMETVIPGLQTSPTHLALDPSGGLYWREPGLLRRANLDGTGAETVTTSLEACPSTLNGAGGGLAFDPAGQHLYFGWSAGVGICRTDTDGGNPETVVSAAYAPLPRGIVLDGSSGRLLFISPPSTSGGPGQIRRGRPDGEADVIYEAPATSLIDQFGSLSIDPAARKVYWPEMTYQGNAIKRANLDGSGVEVVALLPTAASAVFVVGDGDNPAPVPVQEGFIDFETRVDGTPWGTPTPPFDPDEFRSIGLSIISEGSELAIRPDAPERNPSPLLGYRLIVGSGQYNEEDTFVELRFHNGTREVAFDYLNDSGVLRVTAFDAIGQIVANQFVGIPLDWSWGFYIDEYGNTLGGGRRVFSYSSTVHRVRVWSVSTADYGLLPLDLLHIDNLRYEAPIPATTSIDPGASLGPGVVVGSQVTVARGASIGARATLSDLAVVERDAILGVDVFLGVGAMIARDVTIGDRTRIGDGTRIERGATIGADVVLGSNSALEAFVHVSDGVHIGDRTTIGRDSSIGAGATIGSDTIFAPSVQVGPGAVIGNNVTVLRGVMIPAGASIPDGTTVR